MSLPESAALNATFCEGCPLAGEAQGQIVDVEVAGTYGVGLNRTGIAGYLVDAEGRRSAPTELPSREVSNGVEFVDDEFKVVEKSEAVYWSERSSGVHSEHVIEAVAKCEGPEKSRRPITRREKVECPALVARLMPRAVRKALSE